MSAMADIGNTRNTDGGMRVAAAALAAIILAVSAGGCDGRVAGSERTKPTWPTGWKMSFEAAVEPYSHEVYNYDGYVSGRGAVVNGGLGCSGFVSVVLHRMRYGDNWQASYDSKLYQDYGDVIARKSGLPLVCIIESNSLVARDRCQAFFDSRGVNVGAIFVFNVRDGVHGHVGFVRVMPDGWLAQFHYSGMEGYKGLAQGDFLGWYLRSMYKASPVELYGVTNDSLSRPSQASK
jgi:hypothetical protein